MPVKERIKYKLHVYKCDKLKNVYKFTEVNDDAAIIFTKGWVEFDQGEYAVLYKENIKLTRIMS